MFDNIGEKIKTLAKVICWLGIISSVIWGIRLFTSDAKGSSLIGLLVLIIGCFASWAGSIVTYGFGELICNSQEIADNTSKLNMCNIPKKYINNSLKTEDSHVWRCEKCGQLTRTNPCSCCGYDADS